jgi:BirA family biotin operon repressor/biotin-[acetyl-CoA-carboxylase] ligase
LYKIPASSLFVGKNLLFLPECHSTNSYLQELCRHEGVPEGTLVITDHQTAGRGQRNNVWMAEPGKNLTFSVVLQPLFLAPASQFRLSQAVALAIKDALAGLTQKPLAIKWPNDILLNGKKLGGILIENQLAGTRWERSIIGIGLNVNQTLFDLPHATSLALQEGVPFGLDEVLDRLCQSLEVRYLQLKRGALEAVQQDYLNALFGWGQSLRFESMHGSFEGTIAGVEDNGRLLVKTGEEMKAFDLKEIRYAY